MSRPEAKIAGKVKAKFPQAEAVVKRKSRVSISVGKQDLVRVARYLKRLGCDHILSVAGIDLGEELGVAYHVWSTPKRLLVTLKTRVPKKKPVIPSLIKVWEGAFSHEKETHEMLGIEFAGHPDLGRLLLPEDWKGGHPLRKDFKLQG
jgi:NADH-quinone oxidoreductase subunit C